MKSKNTKLQAVLVEVNTLVTENLATMENQFRNKLNDLFKSSEAMVEAFNGRESIYKDGKNCTGLDHRELNIALIDLENNGKAYSCDEKRLKVRLTEDFKISESELSKLKLSELLKLDAMAFIIEEIISKLLADVFNGYFNKYGAYIQEICNIRSQKEAHFRLIGREILLQHIDSFLNPRLGILISQQLDGVPAQQAINTFAKPLDEKNSQIYGTSVYKEFKQGQDVTDHKNSDDKIVIGYSSEGLPFQIVVDGFLRGDTQKTFWFVDQYITPLINDYAEKLAASTNPEETVKELIKSIYTLHNKYAPQADFTMSIGITYQKNNNLYCAGFGIGDTGLVLRRTNGEIIQLAHTTEVNTMKDAFNSSAVSTGIDQIVNRNSTFNVPVNPGDEIFGYTFVFDDLLTEVDKFVEEETLKVRTQTVTRKVPVVKYKLNPDSLNDQQSLFNQVKEKTNRSFAEQCGSVQDGFFGDDCMMSSVTIPTAQIQSELQQKIFQQEKSRLGSASERYQRQDFAIKLRGESLGRELEKSKKPVPEITRVFTKINRALINPSQANIASLEELAQKYQESSESDAKAIGIGLMVLGAALTILGGFILANSLAASSTGILFIPGSIGSAIGAGIMAGGLTIGAVGIGFFAYGKYKESQIELGYDERATLSH